MDQSTVGNLWGEIKKFNVFYKSLSSLFLFFYYIYFDAFSDKIIFDIEKYSKTIIFPTSVSLARNTNEEKYIYI